MAKKEKEIESGSVEGVPALSEMKEAGFHGGFVSELKSLMKNLVSAVNPYKKKYEINKEKFVVEDGVALYQIKAVRDFGAGIKEGTLGGYIQGESNLSHRGDCWIAEKAKVWGKAVVRGNAWIYGKSKVSGYALVHGEAMVFSKAVIKGNSGVRSPLVISGRATVNGNAKISGSAKIYDMAVVKDNAKVYENAQVYEEARIYGLAHVFGNAEIFGKARVCKDIKIKKGKYNIGENKSGKDFGTLKFIE